MARNLAKKLHVIHLNSGALFRAVALQAKRNGIALEDESAVSVLPDAMQFVFSLESTGETTLRIDSHAVAGELEAREVGEWASSIATYPKLREKLLLIQRRASDEHPLVVEGRDAGTVVFPNARWKFYLDAPAEVRADRLFLQLRQSGELKADEDSAAHLAQISADLAKRDLRDSTRSIAPQVAAPDAEIIDCGDLSVSEVVDRIAERVGPAFSS